MSSPTSSSAARVAQLNNFLRALEIGVGRSDSFKALNTSDRGRLLKVLTTNKSLKIQPKNIASIDWNKARNVVIGPVQKLLQDANKSKPVLSTQSVAKKHLHQMVRSKQSAKNNERSSFPSSQDLRSLQGPGKETEKSIAMHALHAEQTIQKYNLRPLIARYCPTEIHTKTDAIQALKELVSLARKLNEAEQIECPTIGTLNEFFELVEAVNFLRMKDAITNYDEDRVEDSELRKPNKDTIRDYLSSGRSAAALIQEAEAFRVEFSNNPIRASYDSFNLEHRGMTLVPREISQLTFLTVLRLGNNRLICLPKEIWSLAKLEMLSLDGNQLTTIPKEIGQLKTLTGLDLSSNRLTSLPDEICQLKALKKFYLRNNQITNISEEMVNHFIASLTSLLDMDDNLWPADNWTAPLKVKLACDEKTKPLLNKMDRVASKESLSDALRKSVQSRDSQKLTILEQLKTSLKSKHECNKIAALLEKMEKIVGNESRSALHRELAQVCKQDPRWRKETQKLGFGRQAFLNPKVDPKLKLKAIEQVLSQATRRSKNITKSA